MLFCYLVLIYQTDGRRYQHFLTRATQNGLINPSIIGVRCLCVYVVCLFHISLWIDFVDLTSVTSNLVFHAQSAIRFDFRKVYNEKSFEKCVCLRQSLTVLR